MNKQEAFTLFEQMISIAREELFSFTLANNLSTEQKADKSVVTECDKAIDLKLTKIAQENGLQVVSEEGQHVLDIIKSGNYMTIDPIDGTLGYLEYVNHALKEGNIEQFGEKDLGAQSDFCLLLGIVENAQPKFAAVYNYITEEKILISSDPVELIRENDVRAYNAENCFYMDQRMGGELEREVAQLGGVISVTQAAFGLKSIYTIVNPHRSAVTVHRVQSAGLWDVLPAAVAAKAFDAEIYDDKGDKLQLDQYILLPGKGATVIKGENFQFVVEALRKSR